MHQLSFIIFQKYRSHVTSTLYKPDTFHGRTVELAPDGVRLRQSSLYFGKKIRLVVAIIIIVIVIINHGRHHYHCYHPRRHHKVINDIITVRPLPL